MLKSDILIYLSKGNLDVKSSFGKITYFLDQEIRSMLIRVLYGKEQLMFDSGRQWLACH